MSPPGVPHTGGSLGRVAGNSRMRSLRPTQTSRSSSSELVDPVAPCDLTLFAPNIAANRNGWLVIDWEREGRFYVVTRTCSELKERHFMDLANITDIPTYLRLCGRPHKWMYKVTIRLFGQNFQPITAKFDIKVAGNWSGTSLEVAAS
jgi:hypothetical protein